MVLCLVMFCLCKICLSIFGDGFDLVLFEYFIFIKYWLRFDLLSNLLMFLCFLLVVIVSCMLVLFSCFNIVFIFVNSGVGVIFNLWYCVL